MKIADRTVLVTGANRGIGQALVEEALRRGAKRVYAGTREPLEHPDRRVTPLTLDVTVAAQIQRAVESVESLDVLINNAGVALYDDLSDRSVLERHLAVNFFGPYGVTQAFLPLLTRSRGASRVQPDSIAARAFGRAGRAGTCCPDRPHRHRDDPRLRHTEGRSGVGCARHLRRSGERRGGHLPRSHVSFCG